MPPLYRLPFKTIFRARFIARPNRFKIECESAEHGAIDAFLPNPGRLGELLLPNATLFVVPALPSKQPRKTQFNVIGVERDGDPVFLHTHINNDVADYLFHYGAVPTLEDARVVRREVTVGRSRFDFLLEQDGEPLYVEVKSCTLFGNGVAMFPDAVTERGRRHLEELAEMGRSGVRTAVVFLVHTHRVQCFMPDYHTDLAFSETFLRVRHDVPILPVSIRWRRDLRLAARTRLLEIPWEHLRREVVDGGNAMLVLHLTCRQVIDRGADGETVIEPGHYIVVTGWHPELSRAVRRLRAGRPGMVAGLGPICSAANQTIELLIRGPEDALPTVCRRLTQWLGAPLLRNGKDEDGWPWILFHTGWDPMHAGTFQRIIEKTRMRPPK